jgi:hypothetical protein
MAYHNGQSVSWHWGAHEACGTIVAAHTQKMTLVIDGTEVTRNGTSEEPAYKIIKTTANGC